MRGGHSVDLSLLEQMRQWGAPADALASTEAALRERARQAHTPVWPEHWHAVMLLLALSTQWHWAVGMAGAQRLGLRYESIRPVLPMVRAQVPPEHLQPYPVLMQQLQHLEDAALAEQARQARG